MPTLDEQIGLCEKQRENGETLLALRAEATEIAASGRHDDVVKVRPEPRGTAREILLQAPLELLP